MAPGPNASPAAVRAAVRQGFTGVTSGLAAGYVQCNLAVVPADFAEGFLAFCRSNPAPLPLIAVTRPGDPYCPEAAAGADLRTDLGGYVWHEQGRAPLTLDNFRSHWRDDAVAFLLGCWFTAEASLQRAGIRLRHVEEGIQGGLFRTSRSCVPAGGFSGPLVVSMRPFRSVDLPRVRDITSRLPLAHGAPLHEGDPAALGIGDLARPDWGEPLLPQDGEVPVYWGCGLTAEAVLAGAGLPWWATHRAGRMFVTDLPSG
jgi:uncharacterized protein YcsI (UPF0317 family)